MHLIHLEGKGLYNYCFEISVNGDQSESTGLPHVFIPAIWEAQTNQKAPEITQHEKYLENVGKASEIRSDDETSKRMVVHCNCK